MFVDTWTWVVALVVLAIVVIVVARVFLAGAGAGSGSGSGGPGDGPRPRELYVANSGTNSVAVFGIGIDERLDPAPLRLVQAPIVGAVDQTGLVSPWGVAAESSGRAFVFSVGNDATPASVSVFPADATGNAAPEGAYFIEEQPTAICLRPRPGALLVATVGFGARVVEFPTRAAASTGALAVDDNLPLAIAGLACDAAGSIYATDPVNHRVLIFDNYQPGSNSTLAPTRIIAGSNTLLETPQGVALGPGNDLYVANRGSDEPYSGSVTIYPAGSNGNAQPSRPIGGPGSQLTRLRTPVGIDVDREGTVYLASIGSVLVFAADANGDVAPLQEVIGADANQIGYSTSVSFRVPQQ